MNEQSRPWWEDSANLVALIRWLADGGDRLDISTVESVLTTPWRWTPEHEARLRADRSETNVVGL